MQTKQELTVGVMIAAVCAAALVLAALSNQFGESSEADGRQVIAEFARIDGLTTNSPVRIAGMTVGKVSSTSLNEDYRVRVVMSVNEDVAIPSETAAIIETDGLFGEKYIELQLGGDEEILTDGDRIWFTQDSVIIEDLIARIIRQFKSQSTSQ